MKALMLFLVGVMTLMFSAMPETLELTSGVHEFDTGQCDECHAAALYSTAAVQVISCTGLKVMWEGGHAGDLPICRSCHPDAVQALQDRSEPHRNIALRALKSNMMEEENEACLMCHAGIVTRFNFSRPQYIEFDMVQRDGDWLILNLTAGQMVSLPAPATQDLNAAGLKSGAQIRCRYCHSDITANISAHYFPSYAHPEDADCSYCHRKSESQHTARSVLCAGACHQDHRGNLLLQLSRWPGSYQSQICTGCHNEDPGNKKPPGDTATHFRVMLEPLYGTERSI